MFLRVSLLMLVCTSPVALGQTVQDNSSRPYPDVRREERYRVFQPPAPRPVRGWISEYQPSRSERRLLEVSKEDQQTFAAVLSQPNTGIIRLFPVSSRRVTTVTELAEGRRPGFSRFASLYSFSKNKHGNGLEGFVDPRLGWAELHLGEGRFVTGFTGESLGVLVALGNVPLETVTDSTEGVVGLTRITPPADYQEATTLSRRNRGGFNLEKFHYGSSLPAAVNMTYALRATSNKRSDILIGFRLISVAENGSVTLIWRKLKVFPKPSWKRP